MEMTLYDNELVVLGGARSIRKAVCDRTFTFVVCPTYTVRFLLHQVGCGDKHYMV